MSKIIDRIVEEFEKEFSKEEYEVDGQTFSELCGIKEYFHSMLTRLESETKKKVRKEMLNMLPNEHQHMIKINNDRFYYADFIEKIRDKLTALLHEEE